MSGLNTSGKRTIRPVPVIRRASPGEQPVRSCRCWSIESHMKSRARQRGLALLELGISISVLITIAFGITEFGRAIYQYNTLAKAVRDATRFLSTRDAVDAAAKDQARCLA